MFLRLLCSFLLPPGQLHLLCWLSALVLICVITVFQRQIKPNNFFFSCMHSSAKINSLAYCLEYVPALLHFIPHTFSLCIRLKLLVLSLEIFFTVCPFYTPCAVRKLILASQHPLWPIFVAYCFLF